jgi:PII-like signaling protein
MSAGVSRDGGSMSADAVKLTAYFGERKRSAGGALVADELLDLYGSRGVRTSILLRGAAGFGIRHQLRTDSSLSLSEDLPAVAVAVDVRERLGPLVDDVRTIVGSGLVTLERVQLQVGALDAAAPAWTPDSPTKLTVYVGRQDRVDGVPAYAAVCDVLQRHGVDGASTLLGVDGTQAGGRQRARFFARNQSVPTMVLAVSSAGSLAPALGELERMLDEPTVTLERVQVCRRDGQMVEPLHLGDGAAPWRKLTVYTSEAELYRGRPIHREITRRLRASGAAGVTTVRGVWGFHGARPPHGDRLLRLGRRVPTVTVVIDEVARIGTAYAVIDELTAEHGLVTCESVPTVFG